MSTRTVGLDGRSGGFGDVWMRLVGLHAAAGLRPAVRVRICVAAPLRPLAEAVFSGRIEFAPEPDPGARIYTNRGLRELLPALLRGKRYLAPLHRSVAALARRTGAKAWINGALFEAADRLGLVLLAPRDAADLYLGYAEAALVPSFSGIDPKVFLAEVAADFPRLRQRLRAFAPDASSASLPPGAEAFGTVVFPSSKGHQYMPLAWAKRNLPGALFCFHSEDAAAAAFRAEGLATALFSKPEGIVFLARGRRHVVTTDSFPSHVLQYESDVATILLTIVRPATVLAPGYEGGFVPSAAFCSPCLHRERGLFPLCQQGLPACRTWDDPEWTARAVSLSP